MSAKWEEVEREAQRWHKNRANWRAWEMEMRGRSIRAKVTAKVESVREVAAFYGVLFSLIGKR